ncbi:MAG TPA: hypothetical protein VMU41_07570 [Candidatus Binataceae bacterium]|nr:hypothetical protein [Candidatus Binataceae bacterium]
MLEAEAAEARRELNETVAAISEKVAAARTELYAPAVSIGVAIAAGLGFMIGSKRGHPLTPLVFAAAGYCGVELLRRSRREP